jgi:uncharacterized protein (TIGR03503 family)
MAIINKNWVISIIFACVTFNVMAHTIYAPNDIPLLDNRFRIDPNTEQVTIILNHPNNPQKVVLVKPDGSKWYAQRHSVDTVAWLSNKDQDIITVQKPMPGPWQAIATLNSENRIELLNPTTLQIDKLPLKVYQKEYLTSYVSLINDGQVMTDESLLRNAKLSVSLTGEEDASQLVYLYKDDGEFYDSLPFDGKLTTHIYLDLKPGRYLLSIKTKNNIFVRSFNSDIVVFPQPITYSIKQKDTHGQFAFMIDDTDIAPETITIDGLISSYSLGTTQQLIVHSTEHEIKGNVINIDVPLEYSSYHFSGKVFATTKDGRELSFELPKEDFKLISPIAVTTPEITNAETVQATDAELTSDKTGEVAAIEEETSYFWIWIGVAVFVILLILAGVLYWLKRKKKNKFEGSELTLDELTEEL